MPFTFLLGTKSWSNNFKSLGLNKRGPQVSLRVLRIVVKSIVKSPCVSIFAETDVTKPNISVPEALEATLSLTASERLQL